MYSLDDTSSTLSNVIFIGNEAAKGGGMHNDHSSPTLTDVPFNENETFARGGGMFVLEVFDLLGHSVAMLADEHRQAGYHAATFESGELPSGLYLYRIQAGDLSPRES